MTVPVGIRPFPQQYATDWGSVMAAATLAMLPTLVLFLVVQKYLEHRAIAGALPIIPGGVRSSRQIDDVPPARPPSKS